VHELELVGGVKGLRHLAEELECSARFESAVLRQHGSQVDSVDVAHGDEENVLRLAS